VPGDPGRQPAPALLLVGVAGERLGDFDDVADPPLDVDVALDVALAERIERGLEQVARGARRAQPDADPTLRAERHLGAVPERDRDRQRPARAQRLEIPDDLRLEHGVLARAGEPVTITMQRERLIKTRPGHGPPAG
jgi:hypothetical protein